MGVEGGRSISSRSSTAVAGLDIHVTSWQPNKQKIKETKGYRGGEQSRMLPHDHTYHTQPYLKSCHRRIIFVHFNEYIIVETGEDNILATHHLPHTPPQHHVCIVPPHTHIISNTVYIFSNFSFKFLI